MDKRMRASEMSISQERQRADQEMYEMEKRLQDLHEQELGREGDLQEANRLLAERQDGVEDQRDTDADIRELEHELRQTQRALNRANSEAAAARAELLAMQVPGAVGMSAQPIRDNNR
jgi:chromosome segregation ATPase